MDFLKELFGEGELSYDKFTQAVQAKGIKLADLATGNYVSKAKYDDDLARRDTTITDLTSQISTRDTDLSNLQAQLASADADNKTKVAQLTSQLETLQTEYANTQTAYNDRLAKQSYEFAVKDFANTKKFTSNAAKRDFINEMINKDLKMEKDKILGAEDFVTAYAEANADAFVVENPNPEPTPKPTFGQPSEPTPAPDANAFAGVFNFMGVRPHNDK